MNLKELAKKFVEQVKAKDMFGAMKTAAEILSKTAATGELLFGGAAAEDLAAEESALFGLKADLLAGCSCEAADGSCKTVEVAAEGDAKAVDPALIVLVVDLVLKLIQARRKNKQ